LENTIQHFGSIERIEGNHIVVRILQASACSSCSAASLCRSSEAKEKEIDVYDTNAADYSVGQHVQVQGTVRQGLQAALWAYVVPLVFMVAVLLIGVRFTGSEGWSALAAVVVLALYYFILYLLRARLQRQLSFQITGVDGQNIL